MILYSYFRSSAAYRVRIALNLKQVPYEIQPVNLLKGEEKEADYLAINAQGLVPALKLDSGQVLTQSPAIIEYLEAQYPDPALLSADPIECARQRALAAIIGCDIHPLNNLRVLKYQKAHFDWDDEQKNSWYAHWIYEGFRAIESQLQQTKRKGEYASGNQPSLVDVYLIPQVYNALRFNVPVNAFPTIMRAYEYCNRLDAFIQAAPENQPVRA